jgi:Xaa-Pro aminopeptidase
MYNNPTDMNSRLTKLKALLLKQSLDAALVSSVPDIIYLTNFSYFSNIEREAFLFITQNQNYIITDGRYSHAVKTQIKNFTLLEKSQAHSLEKILQQIQTKTQIKTLGIDTTNITVSEHQKLKSHELKIKHFDLSKLRVQKDPSEIASIQKACQLGDQTYSQILKNIRIGQTEKQIAFEIEISIKKSGADLSFPTIVAFEENAAIPHHQTSDRKLKNNEFILLDFGIKYNNYCSDMTRTIHFGKASAEKKKAYQTVLTAQQKAIEILKSKLIILNSEKKPINSSLIDQTARTYIISQSFDPIPHSLGHGIGLEVHEPPRLSPNSTDKLENGMVFSIEPGIYLPNKLGIRVEDLFTIQNNKLIQLTNSPKHFIEL